ASEQALDELGLEAEVRALRECIESAEAAVFSLAPRLIAAAQGPGMLSAARSLQEGTLIVSKLFPAEDSPVPEAWAAANGYSHSATLGGQTEALLGSPCETIAEQGVYRDEEEDLVAYQDAMKLVVPKAPGSLPSTPGAATPVRSPVRSVLQLVDWFQPHNQRHRASAALAAPPASLQATSSHGSNGHAEADHEALPEVPHEVLEAYKAAMKLMVPEVSVTSPLTSPSKPGLVAESPRVKRLLEVMDWVSKK
ncbi:unnamed protein product, partial [Polarella glacialis]